MRLQHDLLVLPGDRVNVKAPGDEHLPLRQLCAKIASVKKAGYLQSLEVELFLDNP